jgi:hypothetical protein
MEGRIMSDVNNPYRSPEAGVSPVTPLTSQGTLTDLMLVHLKGASPWLRFIGIMGFISCGVTILTGILFVALIPIIGDFSGTIPGMGEISGKAGAVFGGAIGGYCLIFGVLFFFPSLYSYNFGSKIRSYIRSGADQDLETAFKNNKSLWKFIGIITIISLAFIPLMIIIGIVAGIAMAL